MGPSVRCEATGTYEVVNIEPYTYPDTILFVYEGFTVIMDVAEEIAADQEAYDSYGNSVVPFDPAARGESDVVTKLSRYFDGNPQDLYRYNGVHAVSGELLLVNAYHEPDENYQENRLVDLLTHKIIDRVVFVVARNNVGTYLPRILYANVDSFIEYCISAQIGKETRPYSFSSLYRRFLKNLIMDLNNYVLIFTDPRTKDFVHAYLNRCQNDPDFVYRHLRPVLHLFQEQETTVLEQEINLNDTWILEWNLSTNCLRVRGKTSNYYTRSEPFPSIDDTHLFKPMDSDVNVGYHYTLLPLV